MSVPLQLISMHSDEATRLNRRFAEGDKEAVEFFTELKQGAGECFLCAAPLLPHEGVAAIMPDVLRPGFAMIGRQCTECRSKPWFWQYRRLLKILRAMHPRWHPQGPKWNRH